jgi:hypothetical protein
MSEVATITLDFGTLLTMGALVGVFVAWEWRKVVTIKNEIALLKAEMQTLHQEHQILIAENSKEHMQLIRKLTEAITGMNKSIDQLTYHIGWQTEQMTGKKTPPQLPAGEKR